MPGGQQKKISKGHTVGERDVIHRRAKVRTNWDGIGVSIRHYQIFQNVMPALHDNHRPDNVISGRNRKSRGRTSCDEGEKTFGESVKICKEKDSHNRS